MSEPIVTKRCSHCKEIKPLLEFYKVRKSKDGLQVKCKICCSNYQKKYRQTKQAKIAIKRYNQSEKGKVAQKHMRQTEEYKFYQKLYQQSERYKISRNRYQQSKKGKATKKRYPGKIKAINAVNNAIRDGKLVSPKFLFCHYCPKSAQQYHHWHDYSPVHWLDVVPVCIKCHNKIHRKIA